MSGSRAAIVMSAVEIDAFIADQRICVLVTLGPDGMPDPVPMWFVVDSAGVILMRTFAKSQKAVNLSRDPRFSALFESGERYAELRGVQLTGIIERVDDPDLIADIVIGLALKYEGLDSVHAEAARAVARDRASKQVAFRLQPQRVVSWDHRKLGS